MTSKRDQMKHGKIAKRSSLNFFKKSLGIEAEVNIKRAHYRVKTDHSKKGDTPRTIVCRILNYKDKVKILRNVKKLKGKNIFINEDFYQVTLDHRKHSGRR